MRDLWGIISATDVGYERGRFQNHYRIGFRIRIYDNFKTYFLRVGYFVQPYFATAIIMMTVDLLLLLLLSFPSDRDNNVVPRVRIEHDDNDDVARYV